MGGTALPTGLPTGVSGTSKISDLAKKYGGMTLAELQKKYGGTAATPATPPQTMNWQFPQYSQTWAFTPPTPPPYTMPPPFDAKAASKSSSGNGDDDNRSSSGSTYRYGGPNNFPSAFDW